MGKKQIEAPFAIGDTVELVSTPFVLRDSGYVYGSNKPGDIGLITKVEWFRNGKNSRFQYFFNWSGWHEHENFKLVKKATKASMIKALKGG